MFMSVVSTAGSLAARSIRQQALLSEMFKSAINPYDDIVGESTATLSEVRIAEYLNVACPASMDMQQRRPMRTSTCFAAAYHILGPSANVHRVSQNKRRLGSAGYRCGSSQGLSKKAATNSRLIVWDKVNDDGATG